MSLPHISGPKFLLILVLVAATVGVYMVWHNDDRPARISPKTTGFFPSTALTIGTTTISTELATTTEARTRGLSGRVSLPADSGLLFVFERSGTHGFWMKDMRFPIDIIWIDGEGAVVHIEHAVNPDTYPQVFRPGQPARYVLEVNAGFSKTHDIDVGDSFDATRTPE